MAEPAVVTHGERRGCCSSGTAGWDGWSSRWRRQHGFDVAGTRRRRPRRGDRDWPDGATSPSISRSPTRCRRTSPRARARAASPVVIGTTGWQAHEAAVRADRGDGGHRRRRGAEFRDRREHVPRAWSSERGALMAPQRVFGAWIHELHHAAKKDAPSGTALAMERRAARGRATPRPIADRLDARRHRFPARTRSASTRRRRRSR